MSQPPKSPTPVNRFVSGGYSYDSEGNPVNTTDIAKFNHEFSVLNQAINNGASILSIRTPTALAANQDHYFVLDIPPGKELILFTRLLDVTQGRYHVDAVQLATPLDLTGTIEGAVASIDKTRPTPIQTRIRLKTNVTGVTATVREFGLIDTGTAQTGQARAQGTTGSEGVVKRLVNQSPLRVRKTDDGTFIANLVFICWERDIATS